MTFKPYYLNASIFISDPTDIDQNKKMLNSLDTPYNSTLYIDFNNTLFFYDEANNLAYINELDRFYHLFESKEDKKDIRMFFRNIGYVYK